MLNLTWEYDEKIYIGVVNFSEHHHVYIIYILTYIFLSFNEKCYSILNEYRGKCWKICGVIFHSQKNNDSNCRQ